MRRTFLLLTAALLLVSALAGCAKKAEQSAETTTSDSLVASNPTEQASGNLTPEQQVPSTPPPAQQAPTPTKTTKPRTTKPATHPAPAPQQAPGVTVPSGTAFTVAFTADISSETAKPGDSWSGTVKDAVIIGDRVVFPAGAVVNGTIKDAKPAVKGDRAMLDLEVTSIDANGKSIPVHGSTEPIIAGSTRARNVGAVAGGAAAGALLGKAIGGSGKGALIGGLLGGAAAGAGVAASKGYQVEFKAGKTLGFTVSGDVTVH